MKKVYTLGLLVMSLFLLGGCFNTETTTFTLVDVQGQIVDIYKEVSPYTVAVVSYTEDYTTYAGHGSGLIYDKIETVDGYKYFVITNYHVVESQAYIKIYMGGSKYFLASPHAVHEAKDLALVTFETSDDLVVFGTEQFTGTSFVAPKVGAFVLAVGTPLDLDFFNTATLGIVGLTSNLGVVQHDAAINPGNSGGPLFDLNANLVGFNTWKRSDTITSNGNIAVEGIGMAISMFVAVPEVNNLRTGSSTFTSPKLGITVIDVSKVIEELYEGVKPDFIEVTQDTGIFVNMVVPLRPSVGKIMNRDIIIEVNGQEMSSTEDLLPLVTGASFGDVFSVKVRRYENNEFKTVDLTITL